MNNLIGVDRFKYFKRENVGISFVDDLWKYYKQFSPPTFAYKIINRPFQIFLLIEGFEL
jgi:hypothetical protein